MNNLSLIVSMRLSGYVGVSVNALVVPVVVWKSTGSPSAVGLSLAIEWIPKLLFYLRGGSWASRVGAVRAHRMAEAGRIISMLMLSLAAVGGHWVLAAVAAAISQSCNAISNICFEGMAHSVGIRAHARLSQSDMAASILVVPLAFLLPLWVLPIVGAVSHAMVIPMSAAASRRGVYEHLSAAVPVPFMESLSSIASRPPLVALAVSGLLFGIPVAAIFSFLPATLGSADPSWAEPGFLSIFGTFRSLLCMAALPAVSRVSPVSAIPVPSILLAVSSLASAIAIPPLMPLSLSMLSLAHASYLVWSRQTRQSMLSPSERMSLTGMLISVEASSYLFGALLISASSAFPQQVPFVLSASAVVCLASLLPIFFLMRRRNQA